MILLSPTTSSQDFNVLPRDPDTLTSLSLTITEEGTGTTETFSDVEAYENGDWIGISQAFTILKEHRLYKITIRQDGDLWWRGKARCTSQTDKTEKHTLNSVADAGYQILSEDGGYEIIE
jgi:hypothetical protein